MHDHVHRLVLGDGCAVDERDQGRDEDGGDQDAARGKDDCRRDQGRAAPNKEEIGSSALPAAKVQPDAHGRDERHGGDAPCTQTVGRRRSHVGLSGKGWGIARVVLSHARLMPISHCR